VIEGLAKPRCREGASLFCIGHEARGERVAYERRLDVRTTEAEAAGAPAPASPRTMACLHRLLRRLGVLARYVAGYLRNDIQS